jgi:hypothetical protein
MNGRHRDSALPNGKAIGDQPVAEPRNEVANILAGDSLLYKPLNMIVNFRAST